MDYKHFTKYDSCGQIIRCMCTFELLMTVKRLHIKVPYAIVTRDFSIKYNNSDIIKPTPNNDLYNEYMNDSHESDEQITPF